ncbi:hypothetical protein ACIQY5_21570 [Peribacillus frigoritolerans]|uniref:hypothetical protein n=1 Tax=Peribacillus frigoritolerans TaxID=450367 RepID=UPI0038307441
MGSTGLLLTENFTKDKPLENFDMDLFLKLVEKMIVIKDKIVIVTLLDGAEVEC